MLKGNVTDKLREIGLEATKINNFELVDVEFVKEARNWYLRYYIDKPGGVNLDDCQKVSEQISRQLDIIDPIPYNYMLEVSSPGIERPLKKDEDFIRFIGSYVEIKTFQPIEGKKVFTGELIDFSSDVVTIADEKHCQIPKDKIASAKLKFRWNGE